MIKELSISDLNHYIKSSRAARIDTSSINLEPRFGTITFEFNDLKIEFCTIKFQKRSGDGSISIYNGAKEINTNIVSIRSQDIKIDVLPNNYIEIKRPENSKGDVAILSVSLHYNEFIQENDVTAWKSIISKFKRHSGLRLVDGKLYANFDAVLEPAHNIKCIDTVPTNKFILFGNVIKFTSSCEIIGIELKEDSVIPTKEQLYKHIDTTPKKETDQLKANNLKIIYDSDNHIGLSSLISNNKGVEIIPIGTRCHIKLLSDGSISIPMNMLEPHTKYIFSCLIQKQSGNGSMGISLVTKNGLMRDEKLFAVHEMPRNLSFTFNSGRPADSDDCYVIKFYRPENSNGDVIIQKIFVMSSIINIPTIKYSSPVNVDHIGFKLEDSYKDIELLSVKKFSQMKEINTEYKNYDIKVNIKLTTINDYNWYNKVKSLFSNICLSESPDIIFCSPGYIIPNNKIYLDVFDTLSDSDLDKLKDSKTIISPSNANVQLLNNNFPNTNVIYNFKPWIYVKPNIVKYLENKSYVLAFNRNEITTSQLIQSWTSDMPNLVLVGARGKFPDFVIPVNEYMSYENLMYIISNAKCVIDLPIKYEYISSLLHLVHAAGVPIASTNWFAFDNDHCVFLSPNEFIDGFKTANKELIRDGIMRAINLENKHSDMSNYNNFVAQTLGKLFSS